MERGIRVLDAVVCTLTGSFGLHAISATSGTVGAVPG